MWEIRFLDGCMLLSGRATQLDSDKKADSAGFIDDHSLETFKCWPTFAIYFKWNIAEEGTEEIVPFVKASVKKQQDTVQIKARSGEAC